MNPSTGLSKVPPKFDDFLPIDVYSPQKIKDIYGFQYLIKGEPTSIRGSFHAETFLEENTFGAFEGKRTILSTNTQLNLGDLVSYQNTLYAVENQRSYNNVMQLKHYELVSLYDYYSEFVVDTQKQTNRILGANSMRYFLAHNFGIPIFPSFFKPTISKYLSVDIYASQTRSMVYKNDSLLLEQIKQDYLELGAVGLDTNELQKVAFELQNMANNDFALGKFPSWEQEYRYNKAFDLKQNLQKMDLMVNYRLVTTEEQEADKILRKVFWDFKFI